MTRFAVAFVFGALLSLSISFGLVPLIVAILVALAPAVAWRSWAALSGALVGWGTMWVVLIGSTYTRCVSMGADCVGSDGIAVWLAFGVVVLTAGIAVGSLMWIRKQQPEPNRRP